MQNLPEKSDYEERRMLDLNILLVDDDSETLEQLNRSLPDLFEDKNIKVNIDSKDSFSEAMQAAINPHVRYDLVISDTYKGDFQEMNAAVTDMVTKYREGKFCPIVVYSSGPRPESLVCSAFVSWADKSTANELENTINKVLDLGIPQTARKLHDELDETAGNFLWSFLEKKWEQLDIDTGINADVINRLIRRRAALIMSDLTPGKYSAINNKYGLEYYIYPALEQAHYSLGDIIKNNQSHQVRVILTPHCHLYKQSNQAAPKAEYILTVKTVSAKEVLGEKLQTTKSMAETKQSKKLKSWSISPARTEKPPEGRHWYLPKFLEIPHLYCDFLQVESVSYDDLSNSYERVATLLPPYAEALQECFSSFYGSVGIPEIELESIKDILES